MFSSNEMRDAFRAGAKARELASLTPRAPFYKPAPSEVVQRAAYAIHSATADILGAVNEVNDFQTAMELWQVVEEVTVALMNVSKVAAARPDLINKGKQ